MAFRGKDAGEGKGTLPNEVVIILPRRLCGHYDLSRLILGIGSSEELLEGVPAYGPRV